jgi:hypothetical protein
VHQPSAASRFGLYGAHLIPGRVSAAATPMCAWFKEQGAGYQKRINAVLRRCIEPQMRAG